MLILEIELFSFVLSSLKESFKVFYFDKKKAKSFIYLTNEYE